MDVIANLPRVKTVRRVQIQANLERLKKRFDQVAGESGKVQLEQFKTIMQCPNDHFLDRSFALFDRNKSGYVSKEEFFETIDEVVRKTDDEKLEFLFEVYDVDGDQHINQEELKLMMLACMSENKLNFSESKVHQLVLAFLTDADVNHDGMIDLEEFRRMITKRPGLRENLAISIERWMLPTVHDQLSDGMVTPNRWLTRFPILRKLRLRYIRNNRVSATFFFTWFALCVFLSLQRIHLYVYSMNAGWSMGIARAAGQCLNFNSALVLLLTARKTITWLRSTRSAEYLPLDQAVYFHKMVGWSIAFFTVVHLIAHVARVFQATHNTNLSMTNCLFWTDLNIGWHGTAYITGWLLLLILIIMVVSSLPFVRRRNYFEWFYNLHQLYIPYTLLLMLHGPNFWKWVIGPGLLRLVECVIDRQNYATEVTDATILPSGVINLNIKRPDDFHFYPGDYVLINIPKIARNEWHPFTISSAPEQLEIISLHIKTSGEWTRNLYESYDTLGNVQVECSTGPRLSIADTSIKWKETEQRQQLTTDLTTPVNLSPVQQCTLNVDESFGHTNLSFQPDQTVDVAAPSIAIGTPIKQVFARNAECIALAALPRGKDCRLFNECPIPSPRRIKNTPSTPNATTTIGTNRSMPMESFEALTMRKTIRFPTRILMAGPYSSASSDIFQAEHAVLIAAGIGVTPSASILQSIMLRHEQACHRCPNCEHVFCEARPVTLNKLRKVDFVWVDRSQQSFEWFVQLMAQLEATQNKLRQKDRFLDMHMYVTSARDPSDMKAVGLLLAMDLLQQNYERDLITGLQSRTRAGRPNWDTFFLDLSRQKRGKVTVFFCGGPTMGREIQKHCQKYGFVFRKENF